MKSKNLAIICILFFIGFIIIQQVLIWKKFNKEEKDTNIELVNSIKELSDKIDSISSIRDSLILRIDTTKVKIVELEKTHEKIRDSIVTQSVNADCITFSEYISNYRDRLSSNNNR